MLTTADEAKKIRTLGIGKRALQSMLATARAEARAEAREAALEECAVRCDEVAKGADDTLHGMIPKGAMRSAFLMGRRRGAELCAEAIRARGEGG